MRQRHRGEAGEEVEPESTAEVPVEEDPPRPTFSDGHEPVLRYAPRRRRKPAGQQAEAPAAG